MVRFSLSTLMLIVCALTPAGGGWAQDQPADETATPDDAATGQPTRRPEYELCYKFHAGEVLRTEIVHRATVQTTIQGTSQTAETLSKSVKRWVVDKVDADYTVTFTHSVESIDMWQKTQGRSEVRYNSATDKDVPPGYEEAAEAVGVPLTVVTMTDRGEIIKRQEKRVQPVSMSTQMTIPLPNHPVSIGDSWSTPMDIDVVLANGVTKKIETRQKFTLEKVSHEVATIAVDTQILTPIQDPAIEAQLIQRMSNGHVRFDIAAGRMLSQQLDLDRRVIGFSGPSSSMHYLTRFTETTLAAEVPVAEKQSPSDEVPMPQPPAKSAVRKKAKTVR